MPADWLYTPFSICVSVPNMTSAAKICTVMRRQGMGPLAFPDAIEWGGMRAKGFRTVTVHFTSGFCEGPSAERSEQILTFLRGAGTKIKVFPDNNRTYWVASLDREAAGLRSAAAVELVDFDKNVTQLPELRYDGALLEDGTTSPDVVGGSSIDGGPVASAADQHKEAANA